MSTKIPTFCKVCEPSCGLIAELEKSFAPGFLRGFFWLGYGEQLTAALDLLLSRSIGEQSVVADPHEALG